MKVKVRIKRKRLEQCEVELDLPDAKYQWPTLYNMALHECIGDDVEWRLLELGKPEVDNAEVVQVAQRS